MTKEEPLGADSSRMGDEFEAGVVQGLLGSELCADSLRMLQDEACERVSRKAARLQFRKSWRSVSSEAPTSRPSLIIYALSVVILFGTAAPVLGQPEQGTPPADTKDADAEAKALFAAGREAFEAGRYASALSHWQEAYSISKRPALLYNIGLAHDRLRQDDQAAQSFEGFLAALPDDPLAPEVRARVSAIRGAHAYGEKAPSASAGPPVPSPSQVAAAAPPQTRSTAPQATSEEGAKDDQTPWYGRWYTWAGAGGAVVLVAVIAVAASSSSRTVHAQPNSGLTVQALRVFP